MVKTRGDAAALLPSTWEARSCEMHGLSRRLPSLAASATISTHIYHAPCSPASAWLRRGPRRPSACCCCWWCARQRGRPAARKAPSLQDWGFTETLWMPMSVGEAARAELLKVEVLMSGLGAPWTVESDRHWVLCVQRERPGRCDVVDAESSNPISRRTAAALSRKQGRRKLSRRATSSPPRDPSSIGGARLDRLLVQQLGAAAGG